MPLRTELGKEMISIDMAIKFPRQEKVKKEKKKKEKKEEQVVEVFVLGSQASPIFAARAAAAERVGPWTPEPMYFQEVDCVGLPGFLAPGECEKIIALAEAHRFSRQHRHSLLRFHWTDIIDPFLCKALWSLCGLGRFLRGMAVDGLVPCGLNDVIRIQKYVEGDLFGQHTDQEVRREDGRVSKYSLRVFLNGMEDEPGLGLGFEGGLKGFEGGFSAFHVQAGQSPVVFEPETGLALLYPQGNLCTLQEETEVTSGCKYVLRADVLFCRPDLFDPGNP